MFALYPFLMNSCYKYAVYHFAWTDQRPVQVTCGMNFCVLAIIENAISFVVTVIYKQEPTSGEFFSTHFKNTVL